MSTASPYVLLEALKAAFNTWFQTMSISPEVISDAPAGTLPELPAVALSMSTLDVVWKENVGLTEVDETTGVVTQGVGSATATIQVDIAGSFNDCNSFIAEFPARFQREAEKSTVEGALALVVLLTLGAKTYKARVYLQPQVRLERAPRTLDRQQYEASVDMMARFPFVSVESAAEATGCLTIAAVVNGVSYTIPEPSTE